MGVASTSAAGRPENHGVRKVPPSDRKTSKVTHGGILDDFHRPTEFRHKVQVRQRCHITVRPGMNRDVQLKLFERPGEQPRVVLDIVADHELGRRGLGLR